MFRRLAGWIFNRWTLGVVLLLLWLGLLWWVGPLVAVGDWRPLDAWRTRAVLSALSVAGLLAAWAVSAWRARRGNARVVERLVAAPPAGAPAESADLAAVRQRFEQALALLQRARFGAAADPASAPSDAGPAGAMPAAPSVWQRWRERAADRFNGRYLYQLPWYLIIGAPGTGKTTALRHSGLRFPLADALGEQAVRGVGGTRDCDWWFTDQAVLIDTAGRFTTQDSDPGQDASTWAGFLALLQRSRPRQPLNGVLVAVSAHELLAGGAQERARHARTIRARLLELQQRLGLRLPVYLLITKCDLLAGFAEHFARLDRGQRAAPWGMTFGLQPQAWQSALTPEFDALLQRLDQGLIEEIQAETDGLRRQRIYGFPNQFAALRAPLQELAQAVCAPSPFESDPWLRGVYFVSGTQEGSPIDRVLGAVARRYPLQLPVLPPQRASGRAYFLESLLKEVVFAEQGLAGTHRGWERRRRLALVGGLAALGIGGAAMAGLWWRSAAGNADYLQAVGEQVARVQRLLQETPQQANPDLLPLLPALDATRQLAGDALALADAGAPREDGAARSATNPGPADAGPAATGAARAEAAPDAPPAAPWRLGFGLFQGRRVDRAAHQAYEQMLRDAVLPRLALRLEQRLRDEGASESRYEALKAYLMLHDPARLDAAALGRQVRADWDATLARSATPAQRAALDTHLDALLAEGRARSPLPRDDALVAAVRARLLDTPLPQRVYDRLRQQGLGPDFPPFTPARAGGANTALVFQRVSGRPLTEGIPGLWTWKGYHQGFQPRVGEVVRELADEQPWVLGQPLAAAGPGVGGQAFATERVVDEVRLLYLQDYIVRWDDLLRDLRLIPPASMAQAVDRVRFLAAPDTPLLPLLKAVSRETTLSRGEGVVDQARAQAGGVVQALKDSVRGGLQAGGAPPAPGERPESRVDEHFAPLRRLVTAPEGGKSPLEGQVARLGELQLMLTAAQTALAGGATPPPSPLPNQMKVDAANAPVPLAGVLETLGQASARLTALQQRDSLSREVRSAVGEFCQQAAAGRYPLDAGSSRDMTPQDFAALFGPGGKFEQMQQRLTPFVDTSTRPWSFRQVDGASLGVDAGSLPIFQRAAVVREVFFGGGAAGPATQLTFKPVEMDAGLREFVLDVDGQIVRQDHGPSIPQAVRWPGPRGSLQVRVAVQPTGTGMVAEGPWALWRLFDRVGITPGPSPERFRATFDIDGRKVVFDVTAASVRNPFRLAELRGLPCPGGL